MFNNNNNNNNTTNLIKWFFFVANNYIYIIYKIMDHTSKMEAIKNMKLPTSAPNLDMNVNNIDMASGKVTLNILNRDNGRSTEKVYKSMDVAKALALFVAHTLNINDKQALNEWLIYRGFPKLKDDKEQKEPANIIEIEADDNNNVEDEEKENIY